MIQIKNAIPLNHKLAYIGFALAAFIFLSDQLSKAIIREYVRNNGGYVEITSFFNLVEVWNYGVSFGLFQAQSNSGVMILIAITSMITAVFSVLLVRAENWIVTLSSGLVIGGALGNIIDRIYFGAVHDFLDFHVFEYHWPAFNIADASIVIGIALFAIHSLFFEQERDQT